MLKLSSTNEMNSRKKLAAAQSSAIKQESLNARVSGGRKGLKYLGVS